MSIVKLLLDICPCGMNVHSISMHKKAPSLIWEIICNDALLCFA